MGLTNKSVGMGAAGGALVISKNPGEKVIALAGNPNVGKSTVFNALTGMNQHTGNWPGKTVTSATGRCFGKKQSYVLVDLPGTYSLMAHSAEEEVARNFICFENPDAIVVVCDATCLERNLNLVLQALEITRKVIVCVNLLDEAKRKKIYVDLHLISQRLGVPVVGVTARKKKSLDALVDLLDGYNFSADGDNPPIISYPPYIEQAIEGLEAELPRTLTKDINPRSLALQLLSPDESLLGELKKRFERNGGECKDFENAKEKAESIVLELGKDEEQIKDDIVSSIIKKAANLCCGAISFEGSSYNRFDRKADKIFTGRMTGYPIMLLLLAFVFWLTIYGANIPSKILSDAFFSFQNVLSALFERMRAPSWLHGFLVLGVYRVLFWVVSVMLPPMAIFFPLFTLLEDSGYLPRIAYNLDKTFKKCNACGKQALTMCMGFGCNAAGIVGCRIIDSKRERLLAILTNSFVPCNGRFPTLIAILSMFFIFSDNSFLSSVLSAVFLTLVILIGIFLTFAVTKLLSVTVLHGVPSSFTLELPPYRKPQFGKVIVRSIFDRTLFVLGRSAAVAAPCGGLIWILANTSVGGESLLFHISDFLNPLGSFMGLDGVILMAFILGFPANEIVMPIIVMSYLSTGMLTEMGSLSEMKAMLLANGWNSVTALNTLIFSLVHWPCSTTLLTIYKETGSKKQTFAAFCLPTVIGFVLCVCINFVSAFFI